jgi:hypothetical protein
MLRAAVIWRVRALRMSDVPCPGPAELRRIGQLGPLWAQISARDRGKFASGIGPEGLAVVPGLGHAPRAPPALPTGLRASLQLANTRPPLQTTVYRHLIKLKMCVESTRRQANHTKGKPSIPFKLENFSRSFRWFLNSTIIVASVTDD